MSVKLKIKNSMEKINQRDSFVFYRSYLESIELLSIKKQLLAYKALVKYGLNQEEMENLPPQVAIILKIAKPNIDANIRNYNRRIKNKERKKMSKQGEEYERFVQDVYRVLNANDGLSDVVVQHNVKLKGISREHQIDVYWQYSMYIYCALDTEMNYTQ